MLDACYMCGEIVVPGARASICADCGKEPREEASAELQLSGLLLH
jgi:uncharacterized OB-fold protein